MPREDIAKLGRISSTFGSSSAAEKTRLLARIATGGPAQGSVVPVRLMRSLQDTLSMLQAYPDDANVLRGTLAVVDKLREWGRDGSIDLEAPALEDDGFPGSVNRDTYSLPLLEKLLEHLPGCFEIDWDSYEAEDQDSLLQTFSLLVTSAECQGLDDISVEFPDWFAAARPASVRTDLEFLVGLFRMSSLPRPVQDHAFEGCRVPIRYELAVPGAGRSEISAPVDRVHYQRKELDRRPVSARSVIRRRFAKTGRLGAKAGERFVFLAQSALAARMLEIRTLSYANPADVTLLDCGRGLQVGLIGVVPAYRDPLESHYVSIVVKNGVPIAYGPATVSMGTCEMGLNLFPEFRGAEARFVYAQLMRALHQVLHARYFFLTPYGVGEGNPAAIRSGSFWFYRKLGFRPTNPKVEELARGEERRIAENPKYRSSVGMLRRLSHTSVYLDLSGGTCRPLPLGAIGRDQSRFVAEEFEGDRRLMVERSITLVARALGRGDVSAVAASHLRAWPILAPILVRIPGLKRWSANDKKRLSRILDAKGASSERGVDRMMSAHTTLEKALRELTPTDL